MDPASKFICNKHLAFSIFTISMSHVPSIVMIPKSLLDMF